METRLAEPHPSDESARALLSGVGVIVVGLLSLALSILSGVMTVLLLGLALLLGGVAASIATIRRRRGRHGLAQLLSALLLAGVGLALIVRPVSGLRALTPLLLGLFLADGLFLTVTAVLRRSGIWRTQAAVGVVTLVLGVILAFRWESAGIRMAGTLVGLYLISRGVMLIATSWRVRSVARRAELEAQQARAAARTERWGERAS